MSNLVGFNPLSMGVAGKENEPLLKKARRWEQKDYKSFHVCLLHLVFLDLFVLEYCLKKDKVKVKQCRVQWSLYWRPSWVKCFLFCSSVNQRTFFNCNVQAEIVCASRKYFPRNLKKKFFRKRMCVTKVAFLEQFSVWKRKHAHRENFLVLKPSTLSTIPFPFCYSCHL
jgi:hypothetical protein